MQKQAEEKKLPIYFSDYFNIKTKILKKYGAFNISLVSDIPLFIDPFLLFNSKKQKYQALHSQIIKYVHFLSTKATPNLSYGDYEAWFHFKEVKQNWFGFSFKSNEGRALGWKFANSINANFCSDNNIFRIKNIAKDSHIEKLCLLNSGVGKDNISDLTTNLIKSFLLEYTEKFAKKHLSSDQRKLVVVEKSKFIYETETWTSKAYELPFINNDYVILTPIDILTKDDNWLNRNDMINQFEGICTSIGDAALRSQLNNYFSKALNEIKKKKYPTDSEKREAISKTIDGNPYFIDHYIRNKEKNSENASIESLKKVLSANDTFVNNIKSVRKMLFSDGFYREKTSFEEARKKILGLKKFIEFNDGYKFFYSDSKPIHNEKILHKMFQLICYSSEFDINFEINNGRGAVDCKISKGSKDKTLVEFKLARNTKLKTNLKNQVGIYKQANNTDKAFHVILYFNKKEHALVKNAIDSLKNIDKDTFILINANNSDKQSASIFK